MDRIIVVVGPTASGKTALSVSLARALNGEVVSADSMQLYRGMDIGTAKVTREEMDGIPHHMLDVADPEEAFSAARYVQLADPIVRDILQRGKTVIIAGGTGLYVDALIAGRSFAPFPSTGKRQELEHQADALGMEAMLAQLRQVDPDSAARLRCSARKRILRALEVYDETGKTLTAHNLASQQLPPRYRPLWLGLNAARREDLYARIDQRVNAMLDAGLVAEVQSLLSQGVAPGCTAMQAIGYKELIPVLEGRGSLQDAVETIQRESRRYAKRQLTWFRRNPHIHWIVWQSPPNPETILQEAMAIQAAAGFPADSL